MDVRNCKSCGRLFNYQGGKPICKACKDALEDKFQKVKVYVRQNPNAPITQVADEMDVSAKQIKQWIREERLMLSEASVDGILCEHCGVPIRSGRFCEKCKAALSNSFSDAIEKPKVVAKHTPPEEGQKMRFIHGHNGAHGHS